MNDQIGYRDVEQQPLRDDLKWRMQQSPTGRQLTNDGNFVFSVVDDDPNTSVEIPPDGTAVIYIRAGVKELWAFDREFGWQQL